MTVRGEKRKRALTLKAGCHESDGSPQLLVLMQSMNKKLGLNVQWVAERYPTELRGSQPKGGLSHSSLTAA